MNSYIVERSIETGVLVLICLCLVVVITVALYDMFRTTRYSKVPRVLRNQPHITVLIYARNNAATIRACLKSVMQSTYRHFDVVVVDDLSKDATYEIAKSFKTKTTKKNLSVFRKRKALSKYETLRTAFRRSKKGDLIMVISGDTIMPVSFLRYAAGEYRAFPAQVMKANTRYEVATRLWAVIPRFQQLGRQLQMKVASLGRFEKIHIGESGVLYARDVFMNRRQPVVRASYRGSLTLELTSIPKIASLQHQPVVSIVGIIVGLAVMTYAFYLALSAHNGTLLLFSWLAVSVWFLAALWLDEAEKLEGKLKLTFTLPPLYIFMYMSGFIQLFIAPLKTIFNRG